MYSVSIYADGTVDYLGRARVRTEGHRTRQLSGEALLALRAAIERARFWELRDEYVNPDVRDGEFIILYVAEGGAQKAVVHGSGATPSAELRSLVLLEKHIDTLLDVRRWAGPGLPECVGESH